MHAPPPANQCHSVSSTKIVKSSLDQILDLGKQGGNHPQRALVSSTRRGRPPRLQNNSLLDLQVQECGARRTSPMQARSGGRVRLSPTQQLARDNFTLVLAHRARLGPKGYLSITAETSGWINRVETTARANAQNNGKLV